MCKQLKVRAPAVALVGVLATLRAFVLRLPFEEIQGGQAAAQFERGAAVVAPPASGCAAPQPDRVPK
jgi:hypothetical protein